jgi:hypothetical protein
MKEVYIQFLTKDKDLKENMPGGEFVKWTFGTSSLESSAKTSFSFCTMQIYMLRCTRARLT